MRSHRMEIRVRPRMGLPDLGGERSHRSDLQDPKIGTAIYVDLEAPSPEAAVDATEAMCRRTLANPVIEDFDVFLTEEGTDAGP